MGETTSTLRTRVLQHTADEEEYRLYRAALEWSLEEPIVIDSASDLKSEATWKAKDLTPYDHQVRNLITFCRRLPVTLLADDVGLGKTISAGLVASELISRGRVSRILIVCPKLLMPQWKSELRTKFDLKSEECAGQKLLRYEPEWDIGAIITTYHSARLYLEKIPRGRFDMLVLDEAHKLRNLYGVPQTPQVAKRFRQALADRLFRYVLMLTATPIQNRLWDIYSLVDLLTVARGHENPFGSPGVFTRRFIDDNPTDARRLKPSARDEFRSIVSSYMSRVRRGDAKLQFPERVVRMHAVEPTAGEKALIKVIAEPIQKMNTLAQISILQALVSSPDALRKQLENMAQKGTCPPALAVAVGNIVDHMGLSAKLAGVAELAQQLRAEMPVDWRMVVFTTRRQTQITIEKYLSEQGIVVGTINGASGDRNQETLEAFRSDPPKCNVIVSTEAGSEGVNLQVANVLVNYDLPWNPMIVEQRIGRIQRLQSKFANVCIYNITLAGTFEQYIVGRLMEKLQLASHAIGDIEALLEATGLDDDDDEGGFEEQLRKLVIDSLRGINTNAAAEMAAQSIEDAKLRLAAEERNIHELLGSESESAHDGPKTPELPPLNRSMGVETFSLKALASLGAEISPVSTGVYRLSRDGAAEMIRFSPGSEDSTAVLYDAGTPSFNHLVTQIAERGRARVFDMDFNAAERGIGLADRWMTGFGGHPVSKKLQSVTKIYRGTVLVRVRATVAHDSYERLAAISCDERTDTANAISGLEKLPEHFSDPSHLGLGRADLAACAQGDPAIQEFCRFYNERKQLEVASAAGDERKQKKLEDEFTPRLEFELVGLDGRLHREIVFACRYRLTENGREYVSKVATIPSEGAFGEVPAQHRCGSLQRELPDDCLGVCEITTSRHALEMLVASDVSGRLAIPEYAHACSLSGKVALMDELATSDITGALALPKLLLVSTLSGKKGEPEFFGECAFTEQRFLKEELTISDVSGRHYRSDEAAVSEVSGRSGHTSEFTRCAETGTVLAIAEAQVCVATGKPYRPGIVVTCGETGQFAHPAATEVCAVTGMAVLRQHMKSSAISGRRASQRHFGRCDFTEAEAVSDELFVSEVSQRRYRFDHQAMSAASGKRGHRSEFIQCHVTHHAFIPSECERCSATGHVVGPGILVSCEVTGQKVLPAELHRCSVSGKRVLARLLVHSSRSAHPLLEEVAMRSTDGQFCTPEEAQLCRWSGRRFHPDDIETCPMSGIPHHRQFSSNGRAQGLEPLVGLLNGRSRRADVSHLWPAVVEFAKPVLGKCDVEAAELSPDGRSMAVALTVKKLLGLRTLHAGFVYSLPERKVVGRIVSGQRGSAGWKQAS
jgi:superfamily II DNA or RNA helicase